MHGFGLGDAHNGIGFQLRDACHLARRGIASAHAPSGMTRFERQKRVGGSTVRVERSGRRLKESDDRLVNDLRAHVGRQSGPGNGERSAADADVREPSNSSNVNG